ncbi:MAG: extracellular solute-binding protein [Vulcanimicrobiota bacterium]
MIYFGLALAGCAAPAQVDLRIATGDSAEGLAPHRLMISLFRERNPGLSVQLEPVSGSDYYTRLLTEMASGVPPDVVHLGDEALSSFVRRQALLPLDPLNPEEYLPGVLEPGAGYLVPKDFTPLVCYCNARLFRQAGISLPRPDWDWAEFARLASRLKVDLPGPRSGLLEYMVALEGGDWSRFSGAAAELAVARLQDLVQTGACPPPEDLGAFDGGLNGFEQGTAAFKLSGRWPLNSLKQLLGKDLLILPPPRGSHRVNLLYWSGLGVCRKSRQPELARRYVELCASPEASQIWSGWGLPAVRSQASRMAADPLERVFLEEMQYLAPRAFQRDPSWGELGAPALIRLHEAAILQPHRAPSELLAEQSARLAREKAARP